MGLFSSFMDGSLQEKVIKSIDGLEKVADLAVDKLDGAVEKVEQGTDALSRGAERVTRVADVVESKLSDTSSDSS